MGSVGALMTGGGLLASVIFFLIWRLVSASKAKARLHEQLEHCRQTNNAYSRQVSLLAARIRDLGGSIPDGVYLDENDNPRRD